jgi:large subunit ribosomal protein L24
MKIRKGDRVQVIAGKDRGRSGVVNQVLPREHKVVVDALNVAKRHTKPRKTTMQGGIIDKEMPMDISNVALVCGACGPTRVGWRQDGAGRKVRFCRKCKNEIS